jgi:molybdopterin converting factor subunit 1
VAELKRFTVRYFAAFREAVGTETESVESDAASPAELFAQCRQRHPALEDFSASLVAVNDEMADWQAALADGDEILFFPPVAGG